MYIPLTKPYWGKEEEKAVIAALRTGMGTGDGPYSRKLSKKLKELTGSKYAYPVTSCTHGLELGLAALGLKIGDEVILPSFTMTSTANCVVLRGATPVFADIDDRSYNIDPQDLERIITKKTRGIIVVHYAGMPCRMEEISALAKKHKLFVVEDAAHAIGAKYRGKALGAWGDVGVFSYHGTKNVSCGEGGAVITNNQELAGKMEIYRANGTNRNAFLKGLVDKYSWVGPGSSFFLSDILAGIVCTQLGKLQKIITKRIQIASYYNKIFAPFQKLIQLPIVPVDAFPNWHIYAIRFSQRQLCQMFIDGMRKAEIEVSPHYVPLHTSEAGRKFSRPVRKLPITELVSQTLIRLPIYPGLSKNELGYIARKATSLLNSLR